MTRIPEGEPLAPATQISRMAIDAEFSKMAQDEDYQKSAAQITKEFGFVDAETDLYILHYPNYQTMCEKAGKGFEKFRKKNNLIDINPVGDHEVLVSERTVDVGGNFHPLIRLSLGPPILTSAMYEEARFRPAAFNIKIEVGGATDGEKFMPPKLTSEFQIDTSSPGNVNRKIAPRLIKALRIAQSVTEADLTESRPRLPK